MLGVGHVCVAHDGSVQSVNVDALTQLTITAGTDSVVRFWKFKTCQLIKELKMDAAVAKTVMHRDRCSICTSSSTLQEC